MAQNVFRAAPPALDDPLNSAVAAGAQPVLPVGGMQVDPVVGGLDALFRQFLIDYSPPDYDPAAAAASQGGADGASNASQGGGGGGGDGGASGDGGEGGGPGAGAPRAPPRSYMSRAVEEMATSGTTVLYVDFAFLHDFNDELADAVRDHYGRAEPLMRRALQAHVAQCHPDYLREAHGVEKEFFVGVHNLPAQDALRDLKTEAVGHLVAFSGTVTRASEVRPELFLGTFACMVCRTVVRGVEQQYKYTTPLVCPNPQCNNKVHWHLERDQSTFVDWQRLKVQESVDEIPSGCLPRAMDVILRANNVESAKAGDRVQLTGTLCVLPDVAALAGPGERVTVKSGPSAAGRADALGDGVTGLRQLGARELTYRLVFSASTVRPAQQRDGMVSVREAEALTPEQVLAEYSDRDVRELEAMRRSPTIYADLHRSLVPGVYGHDAVKQAVLLMLFGGVHKRTAEGISLRGDINVAVVGDPSCGKSQILKYVAAFLPRAVYTSGKASTAAGLTASVVKEPENGEFAIEAGALMLADNGICCIDEFDKMDSKDQVAIHEAMEQQTISIAKAGVQATLNARASILAAANPVGGRYDKSKPLKWNVALPPAILSRFDLLHVMVDDTTEYVDERIARHIVEMHRDPTATLAHAAPYTTDALQRYIRYARSIVPTITAEARAAMVRAYKRLRADDAAPGTATAYRITVRQLEALVRLSEATARVYCCEEVRPEHVREAARLLQSSILKVEQGDVALDDLVGPVGGPGGGGGGPGGGGGGPGGGGGAGPAEEEEGDGAGAGAAAGGAPGADVDPLGAGAFLAGHGIAAPTQVAGDGGTAPMDEDGGGGAGLSAAAAGGGDGGGAAEQQQQPGAARPQEPVKISAQEYERIKAMLLRRLREREDAVRADEARAEGPAAPADAGADATAAGAADADPLPADPRAAAASRAAAARYGCRQQELVDWYMERLIDRRAVQTYDQGERAYHLAFRVINHLVRREGLVVVVTVPRRREGEGEAAYRGRLWRERVLALSPSYVPE